MSILRSKMADQTVFRSNGNIGFWFRKGLSLPKMYIFTTLQKYERKYIATLAIRLLTYIQIYVSSKCYVTLFSWNLDPHPPPRSANNVKPYTFVTLFPKKIGHPPPPHLRYVTLEWPQCKCKQMCVKTAELERIIFWLR